MKHLSIETTQYQYLEQSFKEWLDILGYAETTVKSFPVHIRELLHYLEQEKKVTAIKQVKAKHIYDFIRYLKSRPNLTKGGGLSANCINKSIQAINTFASYLNKTAKHNID
ncbi:MAG: site-specific integrase, partial [Bacteroidales bacterium]